MSQDFGDAASAEANGDPGEAVAETEGANGNEAKGDAQPAADAVDEAGGAIAPAGPSEPVHESEPSHNAGAGDSPQPDSASAGRRTIDEARPPSASNRTSTSTSARVSASVTRSSLAVPLSSMAPGDMFIRLAVERLLGMKEGKRVSGLHDAGKAALGKFQAKLSLAFYLSAGHYGPLAGIPAAARRDR